MKTIASNSILVAFEDLPDPRKKRNQSYTLFLWNFVKAVPIWSAFDVLAIPPLKLLMAIVFIKLPLSCCLNRIRGIGRALFSFLFNCLYEGIQFNFTVYDIIACAKVGSLMFYLLIAYGEDIAGVAFCVKPLDILAG